MKTKRLPLFVVPLLLIITSAQAQTPSQPESPPWKMYTVQGEDFSVALPLVPAAHVSREYIDRSGTSRFVFSMGCYADGVVYVTYVYENRKRQSLDSFLKSLKISNATVTDLSLDGVAGKAVARDESLDQIFATEKRLYRFSTLGAPVNDPRITKFFSAVSLRSQQGSIPVVDGPGEPYEPAGEPDPLNDETTKKFYVGKDVDRKVRLGMKPEPQYTEIARQRSITGTVVLKCIFSRNGSVVNIVTVSGLPDGLTENAVNAARKIKFIPAIKNGKYVSMWMQLEYNFNLF